MCGIPIHLGAKERAGGCKSSWDVPRKLLLGSWTRGRGRRLCGRAPTRCPRTGCTLVPGRTGTRSWCCMSLGSTPCATGSTCVGPSHPDKGEKSRVHVGTDFQQASCFPVVVCIALQDQVLLYVKECVGCSLRYMLTCSPPADRVHYGACLTKYVSTCPLGPRSLEGQPYQVTVSSNRCSFKNQC